MVVRMWCYREPTICHYANYNDNFLCLLWWQSWHHDNYPFSVHCRHLGPETVYINSLLFDYSAADLDHHWSRQWHTKLSPYSLRWRHNGRDRVSNHQPHHGLLYRLFRRRSKKTSKLRVTGLCVGNSPGTGAMNGNNNGYSSSNGPSGTRSVGIFIAIQVLFHENGLKNVLFKMAPILFTRSHLNENLVETKFGEPMYTHTFTRNLNTLWTPLSTFSIPLTIFWYSIEFKGITGK